MSGHSHWAKVKRGKAVTDARRGRLWGKLARKIIVAARSGGGNPSENLMLRYAIDEARAANMPNDTIDRAIKKGVGELGGADYERVLYEGYGPGGVAFLIECLTDNRSRTAPELRSVFDRHGGQLAGANAVAWMFQSKGTLLVPAGGVEEDALLEVALEAGAEDVRREGEDFEVLCEPAALARVRQAMEERKVPVASAAVTMIPNNRVPVAREKAGQVLALLEALEDHDDVQNVYANFDMPEEALAVDRTRLTP
jgi:YebC/PmpR family DNA-binding regulatory protein